MNISIIVPFFNEGEGLSFFLDELLKVSVEAEAKFDCEINYIFVDDGSDDNSRNSILQKNFKSFETQLIVLSRNFGKEAALSAGIQAVKNSDAAIMIDSDLEHPPYLIHQLIETWINEKADSIFYYKEERKSEGAAKYYFSNVFYYLINKDNRFSLTKNAGDFRLINLKFINALKSLPESERFLKGLYGWVGFKQIGVPFSAGKREHGESKFSKVRLVLLALDGITSFTTSPLRLMMIVGSIVCLLSVLYGLYIILETIFFPSIQAGLASVLTLISFFGGLQIFSMGLIGEYIGKTLIEAKRRPPFIVDTSQTINHIDRK